MVAAVPRVLMPHCHSIEGQEKRRLRAAERGYLRPCPRGTCFVAIAAHLAPRLRHIARSLELHDSHNQLAGRASHYARNATLAAELPDDVARSALACHREANRAKHQWSSPQFSVVPLARRAADPVDIDHTAVMNKLNTLALGVEQLLNRAPPMCPVASPPTTEMFHCHQPDIAVEREMMNHHRLSDRMQTVEIAMANHPHRMLLQIPAFPLSSPPPQSPPSAVQDHVQTEAGAQPELWMLKGQVDALKNRQQRGCTKAKDPDRQEKDPLHGLPVWACVDLGDLSKVANNSTELRGPAEELHGHAEDKKLMCENVGQIVNANDCCADKDPFTAASSHHSDFERNHAGDLRNNADSLNSEPSGHHDGGDSHDSLPDFSPVPSSAAVSASSLIPKATPMARAAPRRRASARDQPRPLIPPAHPLHSASAVPTPMANKTNAPLVESIGSRPVDSKNTIDALKEIKSQLADQGGTGKVSGAKWRGCFGAELGKLRAFLEARSDEFDVIPGRGTSFTVSLKNNDSCRTTCSELELEAYSVSIECIQRMWDHPSSY